MRFVILRRPLCGPHTLCTEKCSCGVVANLMDCDVVVSSSSSRTVTFTFGLIYKRKV